MTKLCFALLDHRVTNQIYLAATGKASSDNLSQSDHLIRHCLSSEYSDARIELQIHKSICLSVIKQCKTRKTTFRYKRVP